MALVASVGGGLSPKIMDSMIAAQNQGGWSLPKKIPESWGDDYSVGTGMIKVTNLGYSLFSKWTPAKQKRVLTNFARGSGARLTYNGAIFGQKKISNRYPQLMEFFYILLGLSYLRDTLTLKMMLAKDDNNKELKRKYKRILSKIVDKYLEYFKSPSYDKLRRLLAKTSDEETLPKALANVKTGNFLKRKIEKNPKALIQYLTHVGEYGQEAIPDDIYFPSSVYHKKLSPSKRYYPPKSIKNIIPKIREKLVERKLTQALSGVSALFKEPEKQQPSKPVGQKRKRLTPEIVHEEPVKQKRKRIAPEIIHEPGGQSKPKLDIPDILPARADGRRSVLHDAFISSAGSMAGNVFHDFKTHTTFVLPPEMISILRRNGDLWLSDDEIMKMKSKFQLTKNKKQKN